MRIKINKKIIILVLAILGIIASPILTTSFIHSILYWNYFLTENADEQFSNCAMSEDGKFVVVGSGNDYLYLFTYDNSTPLWRYRMNSDVVRVDISADGQYIIACEEEGAVWLFEKDDPNPILIYKYLQFVEAKISADGNYIIMFAGETLLLYQRDGLICLWTKHIPMGGFPLVEISDDGNEIVATSNGILYYFERSSSSPIWQYDTGEIFIMSLVISADGDLVAVGGQNRRIDLFNKTCPIPFRSYYTSGSIRELSMSEDGSYVIAGCPNECILYYCLNKTYLWIYPVSCDSSEVAISSDGNYIIVGNSNYDNEDYILYCFNNTQGEPCWSSRVKGIINNVAISKYGDYIGVVTQNFFYYIDRIKSNIISFT
ncbi:MAG: WD40 repeat domain-containing protein [Promethearchaeota archaeon]|nr:MAG: WD40 repeat domain-containing protein [Candidatus Lokiarchaeota archaeon]